MFDYAARLAEARKSGRPYEGALVGLDPAADFLLAAAGNITSQHGEDGILAALFEKIGAPTRTCFEVGAYDGVYLSNTWALCQVGWKALLVECDGPRYDALVRNYGETACCVKETVGPGSLDRLLALHNFPRDLDLGVLDVDGEEVALWWGLKAFRPRVLLVECNGRAEDGILGGTNIWQSGWERVQATGTDKGYTPILRCGVNILFVDALTWRQSVG